MSLVTPSRHCGTFICLKRSKAAKYPWRKTLDWCWMQMLMNATWCWCSCWFICGSWIVADSGFFSPSWRGGYADYAGYSWFCRRSCWFQQWGCWFPQWPERTPWPHKNSKPQGPNHAFTQATCCYEERGGTQTSENWSWGSAVVRYVTVTGFCWPNRCARSSAWRLSWGFHDRSWTQQGWVGMIEEQVDLNKREGKA